MRIQVAAAVPAPAATHVNDRWVRSRLHGTVQAVTDALESFDALGAAQALETFVDTVMARWEEHPGMHVYHFSPYEPAAVKRLVGRHGTREEELDRLLRAERFVDLFAASYGIPKRERPRKVAQMLDLVGLSSKTTAAM